jgi:hypothetical protein
MHRNHVSSDSRDRAAAFVREREARFVSAVRRRVFPPADCDAASWDNPRLLACCFRSTFLLSEVATLLFVLGASTAAAVIRRTSAGTSRAAFLIASFVEEAKATGTAATSFALDKPPTPSQGASRGNSDWHRDDLVFLEPIFGGVAGDNAHVVPRLARQCTPSRKPFADPATARVIGGSS